MKRNIILVLALTLLFATISYGDVGVMPIDVGISDEIELLINEEKIFFSDYAVEPYEKNGLKMLPLRAISENLGFEVRWNEIDKSIDLKKDTQNLQIYVGNDKCLLNSTITQELDIAPEIMKSRTFVPYTFFEEILETDIQIDNNKITINGYVDYVFDIEQDQSFSDIVVDVPTNYMENNFYEYEFEISASPVKNMGNAIRISGSNHSDDMFMGFYKKITGLEANETYIYKLSFDIGTNIPKGMGGIGGSPGSSVYVKAGIVPEAPLVEVDQLDHYRFSNLDKSNQSQSGVDLKVVTDMEKKSNDYSEDYEYKTIVRHFIATTNENGEAYIIVGTDSGFEGLTTVYYDNIKLSVKGATEYNKSVVQDVDYELMYVSLEIGDNLFISVPKATNFINVDKQNKLNLLIDEKVDEIVNKEKLESLRFSYNKKDNDLLSIVFNGSYSIEGGSFAFYEVLNVNTKDMEEIYTDEFIKQDEDSITALNTLFASSLDQKGLERTTINNGMKIFYEQGMYIITFLNKDSDNRETMILFNESEVSNYLNYWWYLIVMLQNSRSGDLRGFGIWFSLIMYGLFYFSMSKQNRNL